MLKYGKEDQKRVSMKPESYSKYYFHIYILGVVRFVINF